VLCVETVGRIRRLHLVEGRPIEEIVRLLKVSRNTVRRVLRAEQPKLGYERAVQPRPRLGPYATLLEQLLEEVSAIGILEPVRDRHIRASA
jgi:predicted transcriptional regulator